MSEDSAYDYIAPGARFDSIAPGARFDSDVKLADVVRANGRCVGHAVAHRGQGKRADDHDRRKAAAMILADAKAA
jgi:hypothetical protein